MDTQDAGQTIAMKTQREGETHGMQREQLGTQDETINEAQTALTAPDKPVAMPEWARQDLERSGITQDILSKLGYMAPHVISDPETVWYRLLNNEDQADGGYIKPRELGEVLAFPYPEETFERDGETVPFTRVKPHRPRLVGERVEYIESPDGTKRKLTARERRQVAWAEAGEETHGGTPWCTPSGYKVEDRRKPVKYESPRGQGQRLYDIVSCFHGEGLGPEDELYLIEGEKKAICANAYLGWKAYGLPGVTGAHDVEATNAAMDAGSGGYILHSKIKAHCRRGGTVVTVFDAPDVSINAQVVRAQATILRAVTKAGGKAKMAIIPDDIAGGRKRGIDDFVVECGARRVLTEVRCCSALPFQALKEFDDMDSCGAALHRQLCRCLALHAGAWFAGQTSSLKKWVRKAAKVFDRLEEELMEWCNETAHVYQETSQQRIIREIEQNGELLLGKGELRMDERTEEIYLGGRILRSDSTVTNVRASLSFVPNRSSVEPTRDDVRDAIRHIAEKSSFHPVREYLEGLEPWDRTSRIEKAIVHLGVNGGTRDPLQGVLLRKFLISAVARAFEPGCKVDTMLILHGPQGVGKSSFLRALCREPTWFTDQGFDVNDKDAALTINRFWIVEWSELDNLRRASRREVLKAFVARPVDSVRPPYGRSVVDMKRSCVFAGTTNDDMFLDDPTGHRRFWIISDVENVEVEWFEKNRDALWAEAFAAYQAGEHWWLNNGEEEALRQLQRRHEVPSQWASVVEDYLSNGRIVQGSDGVATTVSPPDSVTLCQVLEEAIGKPKSRHDKRDQREVADLLKSLGWKKDEVRSRANNRQPVWRRPTGVSSIAAGALSNGLAVRTRGQPKEPSSGGDTALESTPDGKIDRNESESLPSFCAVPNIDVPNIDNWDVESEWEDAEDATAEARSRESMAA